YFDKNESICYSLHWEHYFQHIIQKYNNTYKVQMPVITPHVCRHTYCSNMAKSGMNPKVLQYLMGHSDISVTLNTYTHLKIDDAKEEMEKLAKAQAATEEISKANGQEKKLKDKGWKMA
uniref:tyrosine-type recombinase/integrase n=1 Tax=Blautia sp. TaxID=1955243 RepID=UPI003AB5919D